MTPRPIRFLFVGILAISCLFVSRLWPTPLPPRAIPFAFEFGNAGGWTDITFAPDGESLVWVNTMGPEPCMEFRDLRERGTRRFAPLSLNGLTPRTEVVISKSGEFAACNSREVVSIWNLSEKRETHRFDYSGKQIRAVRFDPLTSLLRVFIDQSDRPGYHLDEFCLADAERSRISRNLPGRQLLQCVSPQGNFAVVADEREQDAVLISTSRDLLQTRLPRFGCALFTDDEKQLLVSDGGDVVVHELPSGRPIRRLRIPTHPRYARLQLLAVSTSRKLLVVDDFRGSRALFVSLESGKIVGEMPAGDVDPGIVAVRFSPRGDLATARVTWDATDENRPPVTRMWIIPKNW